MSSEKSSNILSTSSNLLGFCLIVLTSLEVTNYSVKSVMDEFTGVAALFLGVSCVLSFLSIQSASERRSTHLEKGAVWFFLISLAVIFIVILLVAFSIII